MKKPLLEEVKKKIKNAFFLKQWVILFNFNKRPDSLNLNFSEFKRILPPKDRLWADPFIHYHNGKFYIFFEELIFKEGKGTINVMMLDKDGTRTTPKRVLQENYHLSYPFLFNFKEDLYMIPESKKKEEIRLYKCDKFPYAWSFKKTLIKGIKGADSTIFKHNGKFYLFTSIRNTKKGRYHEELFIYWSDNPVNGAWKPHELNPVIVDPMHSRPSGNIFMIGDRPVRPTHHFINGNAYGMKLCEILELDHKRYDEKIIMELVPDWDNKWIGIHTLNHTNGLTVIDAKRVIKRY